MTVNRRKPIIIEHRNATKALADIPENSVDLIFTDPPYPKEYVNLYGVLAKEAKRILKSGKYVFAYCGAHELPEIIKLMSPHLEWFWLFEIKHNGGYPRVWNKKILVASKPVVVFTKGKPAQTKWICSLHSSERADKSYHKWGQSCGFPRKIIEMYTKEGDLVVDPFLGGGTTAKCCKELNRRFIGFDVDQKCLETTINRLKQEQLFTFTSSVGDLKNDR